MFHELVLHDAAFKITERVVGEFRSKLQRFTDCLLSFACAPELSEGRRAHEGIPKVHRHIDLECFLKGGTTDSMGQSFRASRIPGLIQPVQRVPGDLDMDQQPEIKWPE